MFICEKCHKEANCDTPHWIIDMLSLGNCEVCGNRASCADCHSYNFNNESEYVIEKPDIKAVGDWILGILTPTELNKIIAHKAKRIEPASDLILNIQITLFELEALQHYGHLPNRRNCFELKVKPI